MTSTSMPVFPGDLGAYTDQAPAFGSGEWAPREGKHRGGRKVSGRVRKPNRRAEVAAAAFAGAYGFGALFTAIGCVVR